MFLQAWQTLLRYYDKKVGIAWKWQALDGVITKVPPWAVPRPVLPPWIGAKRGTKRSVLTDQRGAPLSLVVTGANTPDKMVALATLDGIVVPRPVPIVYRRHHLCLDRGYP